MSEEVRLDETCVEQKSTSQVSPDVPEDNAQDDAPTVANSEFGVQNPELIAEFEEPEIGDVVCEISDLDLSAQAQTVTGETASEAEAVDGSEEAGISAPIEEAEAPGCPVPDNAMEPPEVGDLESGSSDWESAYAPQADTVAVACEMETAVESQETSDIEQDEQAEQPKAPVFDEQSPDASEESLLSDAAPISESFEEMLEKSIKTLHTGQKVSGVVTSITATEVSVDLGTKQSGYIPISEFTDDANTKIEDIIRLAIPSSPLLCVSTT